MSVTKTPYSVLVDLGKIVAKDYFLEFTIGDDLFRFTWKEHTVGELLEFIKNIDSAFEPKSLKYQVSVENQVYNFLHKLNPKFKEAHFNLLGPENINKIIEAIVDPLLRKEESNGNAGNVKKKIPVILAKTA